jgi:hypothetical protein
MDVAAPACAGVNGVNGRRNRFGWFGEALWFDTFCCDLVGDGDLFAFDVGFVALVVTVLIV